MPALYEQSTPQNPSSTFGSCFVAVLLFLLLFFYDSAWLVVAALTVIFSEKQLSSLYFPLAFVVAHTVFLIASAASFFIRNWSLGKTSLVILACAICWTLLSLYVFWSGKDRPDFVWETHTVPISNPPVCGQWEVTKGARPTGNWWHITEPSQIAIASQQDVWAIGSDAPWDAGRSGETTGVAWQWNGSEWKEVNFLSPSGVAAYDLSGVIARGPNDVLLFGDEADANRTYPTLYHWDGSGWDRQPNNIPGTCDLSAVDLHDPSNMWALTNCQSGYRSRHWDISRRAWVDVPISDKVIAPGAAVNGLDAITPDSVWAVGRDYFNGAIAAHWNGSVWESTPVSLTLKFDSSLYEVASTGVNDVWAVGYVDDGKHPGLAVHWDGDRWQDVPLPPAAGRTLLKHVAARAEDDVWASGYRTDGTRAYDVLLHWDGVKWSSVDTPPITADDSQGFTDIAVAPAGDLWATAWEQDNSLPRVAPRKKDALFLHLVRGSCSRSKP